MDEFVGLVKKMREAQKNYFSARHNQEALLANHWFGIARDLEKKVDATIEDYGTPKLF